MSKEKICGVYEIINSVNKKIYIGSSVDIYNRWKDHVYQLNNNIHSNVYLQHAWNKYGSNNFDFKIIERCNKNNVRECEQYYIDLFNCCNRDVGYNIMPRVDMSELSEETKNKISIANKGKHLGESASANVYSENIILNVIDELLNTDKTYMEIANEYDMKYQTVANIAEKRQWFYLTENISFPKRNCGRRIDKSKRDEIINLLLQGKNNTEISNITGISKNTISCIRTKKMWANYTKDIIFPKPKIYNYRSSNITENQPTDSLLLCSKE